VNIVKSYPPNFREIIAAFPSARQPGTIFCYGETIHNPSGRKLSQALINHERVHADQQIAAGVEQWWASYLTVAQFRFQQELEAHVAEWLTVVGSNANRNERRMKMAEIAKRLSGPLYGNLITFAEAKRLLKKHGDFKENEV